MTTHLQKMLASGRRAGAVGSAPTILTQYLIEKCERTLVLDFGAGKFRNQTKHLRHCGFKVVPFDLPGNMRFYPTFEKGYWNVLMDFSYYAAMHRAAGSGSPVLCVMSNVLNVQQNLNRMWGAVDDALWMGADCVYANYPESPRYSGEDYATVLAYLQSRLDVTVIRPNLTGTKRGNKHRIMRIRRKRKE